MAVPTFQTIVVVDIESFGSRPDTFQASLRRAMYDVVRESCDEAGVDWRSLEVLDRGDGMILLAPPATSGVTLAGPFVRALDAVLAERAARSSEAHRMRMRVALHHGQCGRDDTGWVGAAINTACRLVDAPPLRAALGAAPDARMALIVSDDFHDSIVRHHYRYIDPAAFGRIRLTAKELHDVPAWISVPGRSYPPGVDGPAPAARGDGTGDRPAEPRLGVANHATTVHGDQVAGDKTVYQGRAGRDG